MRPRTTAQKGEIAAALREKVWQAFVNRGDNGDANDTNGIIAEILALVLLGCLTLVATFRALQTEGGFELVTRRPLRSSTSRTLAASTVAV